MGLRGVFCALFAVAAAGVSVASAADEDGASYHRTGRRLHYYSRSYPSRIIIGGERDGRQHGSYAFGSPAYNYPGYNNNHTFWERVETQAQYPVQY